jgi:hypothetical protein
MRRGRLDRAGWPSTVVTRCCSPQMLESRHAGDGVTSPLCSVSCLRNSATVQLGLHACLVLLYGQEMR